MKICINGKDKEYPPTHTLETIIHETLGENKRVVAELNGKIIKKNLWPETKVFDSDRLELVSIVGGG